MTHPDPIEAARALLRWRADKARETVLRNVELAHALLVARIERAGPAELDRLALSILASHFGPPPCSPDDAPSPAGPPPDDAP